eukprot:4116118-Prymnesium_polylepis.1
MCPPLRSPVSERHRLPLHLLRAASSDLGSSHPSSTQVSRPRHEGPETNAMRPRLCAMVVHGGTDSD